MDHYLVVVDMQNDFITGSLGTNEARGIVPHAVDKIENFDGTIIFTQDLHDSDYSETLEGNYITAKHCIKNSRGADIDGRIINATKNWVPGVPMKKTILVRKNTFGSLDLPNVIKKDRHNVDNTQFDITLIGLCTDICVVSNALILRAAFPNVEIYVDSKCCAGTSQKNHEAALVTMESCLINVK